MSLEGELELAGVGDTTQIETEGARALRERDTRRNIDEYRKAHGVGVVVHNATLHHKDVVRSVTLSDKPLHVAPSTLYRLRTDEYGDVHK